jgi:PAS domain S-box-containing protein
MPETPPPAAPKSRPTQQVARFEQRARKSSLSGHRLEALFQTMTLGVVYQDREGRVLAANPAAERILGLSLDQMLGRTPLDARWQTIRQDGSLLPPEDHPAMVALRTGKAFQNVIIGVFHPEEDTHRWVLVNAVPQFKPREKKPSQVCVTFQDITGHRKTEQALRAGEERFRSLVETTSDWIWEVDARGLYTYASPRVHDLLGYEPAEMIGKTPFSFMPPQEAERVAAVFRQVVESRQPFSGLENLNLHKDGREVLLETSGVPVFDEQGVLTGYRGIDRDISERKRAEEGIHRNEVELRSIFTAAPVGIGLVANRILQKVNDRICEMTGYAADELVGRSSRILYPSQEDFEWVGREKYRQIAEHGTGMVETRWRRKDGRIIDVLLSSTPLDPKDFSAGVTFTALDITKRKRAETALRESEARIRALFRALTDGVYVHHIDPGGGPGQIIDVNDVACRMLGYTREELLGLSISDVDAPESTADVQSVVEQLKEGRDVLFEQLHVAKDGRRIPVEIHVCAFNLDDVPILLSTVRDISARKTAEQERERLLRELEAKNREMESLVYVASHDLRTPLVNILGFGAELEKACRMLSDTLVSAEAATPLRDELAPILEDSIPTALRFIKASGAKMDILINGLLRLSRTGRTALRIRQLDMNQILDRVIATLQFRIQSESATIEVGPLPPCQGDADQINQVFSNLLDNALKYRAQNRPLILRVHGRVDADDAIYCVEDTGRGIAPAHQARIWDLFHRLDPQDPTGGEGLGLTLARRIVERHGGRVWVESEPGQGSRFYVALPAAPQYSIHPAAVDGAEQTA